MYKHTERDNIIGYDKMEMGANSLTGFLRRGGAVCPPPTALRGSGWPVLNKENEDCGSESMLDLASALTSWSPAPLPKKSEHLAWEAWCRGPGTSRKGKQPSHACQRPRHVAEASGPSRWSQSPAECHEVTLVNLTHGREANQFLAYVKRSLLLSGGILSYIGIDSWVPR